MFALVAAHTLVASAFITAPFIPRPSPQRSTPASVVMDAEGDTTELKETLLQKAAEFKAGQQALWQAETETAGAPLGAGSLANIDLTEESLSALRDDVIAAIEALAATNPNPTPLQGWRTPEGCGLQGAWSLLFTTGADATFKPGKQGAATTYQEIDSRKGLFVNCVDFDQSTGQGGRLAGAEGGATSGKKLAGFRVVVAGKRLSDTEVQLYFKRVKLLRPTSRLPFLRTITIPLPPSWLLRGVARRASRGKAKLSDRGAGFEMLYLDETLRMHKTFDGQYFVQQRKAE